MLVVFFHATMPVQSLKNVFTLTGVFPPIRGGF